MSRQSWTEGVDWFWVMFAVIAIATAATQIIQNRSDNATIQACIHQGKHPVIDGNQLRDCK